MVALALLGVAAVTSWSNRANTPVRLPPPPVAAELAASVPARVLKVVDGDTFDARVELRPGFRITTRVRVRGVDAPELHAACEQERVGAEAAQRALRAILAEGGVTIHELARTNMAGSWARSRRGQRPASPKRSSPKGVVRRYEGGRRAGWC